MGGGICADRCATGADEVPHHRPVNLAFPLLCCGARQNARKKMEGEGERKIE